MDRIGKVVVTSPSSSVLDLNNQDTKAVADEKSVSMFSQIFSEKPKQVIEEVVRRANENVALAAQEILVNNTIQYKSLYNKNLKN